MKKSLFIQGIFSVSLLFAAGAALAEAPQKQNAPARRARNSPQREKMGSKKAANNAVGPKSAGSKAPRPSAQRLAAGDEHTCTVRDGRVFCWGNNAKGQLGQPLDPAKWSLGPSAVASLAPAVSVAAGRSHTCALLEDRTVSCWGDNSRGQLGDGTSVSRHEPKRVPGLEQVTFLSAGTTQTCASTVEGAVYCWGENGEARLKPGPTGDRALRTPTLVPGVKDALSVTTYSANTCALLANGELSCWGDNTHNQRGAAKNERPAVVEGFAKVRSVGVGYDFVCAAVEDGNVSCLGWNHLGQLGRKTEALMIKTPIQATVQATSVAVSNAHACARHGDGSVTCWGTNPHGQLGDGTETPKETPVKVAGLVNVAELAVGRDHSCALLADGQVTCWGNNYARQLGSEGPRSLLPAPVAF